MSFSNQDPGIGLKKFVSQDELEEKRKQRQEEWEKVRKPEDPAECPEEVYDPRSLFEQLEAQKQKKQDEYDDQVRQRSQVKGLEEDEAQFLSYVSNRQVEIDHQRKVETASVLQEMRDYNIVSVSKVQTVLEEKKPVKPQVGSSQGKSQMALLAGAIKRKSTDNSDGEKKMKLSEGDSTTKSADNGSGESKTAKSSVAQIIGVLPGVGEYTNDTSDSESSSSDSEVELKPNQQRIIIQQK